MVDELRLFAGFSFAETGPSGVYLLLRKGEVVYVGQSVNIFQRIGNHWQVYQRHQRGTLRQGSTFLAVIAFDAVQIKPCPEDELDAEEKRLIQRYLPKHNICHNRPSSDPPTPKIDISQLDFIKKFVKKEAERQQTPNNIRRRGILPPQVRKLEKEFQRNRDGRMPTSLPRMRFLNAD